MTALASKPPLRLMIYDKGDTTTTIKRLRQGLSKEANQAIDHLDDILPGDFEKIDIDIPLGLTYTWLAGGRLFRLLRRFDHCEGFTSWAEALDWLASFGGDQPIGEIQYWGHGSPAKVWMVEGREALTADSPFGDHADAFAAIKKRLAPEARIWLRCCSVFAGERGHEFAKAWASYFNRPIVAHTFIIGFWHSGLHTMYPDSEPHWPKMEGIMSGTAEKPTKLATSSRAAPCTTWFLNNHVPAGW